MFYHAESRHTMKKQLSYETFDTHYEAEDFVKDNKPKYHTIVWHEDWFYWVVWYKQFNNKVNKFIKTLVKHKRNGYNNIIR